MTCKFVYEIGGNHNGSVDRLRKLIEAAGENGADAVKIQWVENDSDIYRKGFAATAATIPSQTPPELIKDMAESVAVELGFSVFNADHIDKLEPVADFFKVSSYDLLRLDLIKALAETEKPLVLSTGMATLREIFAALETAVLAGCGSLYVLHCVSLYPALVRQANLSRIEDLHRIIGSDPVAVGYSDHTRSLPVVLRALCEYRIEMLEVHFDLADGAGVEAKHSWSPEAIDYAKRMWVTAQLADLASSVTQDNERAWRADPIDGRRPMLASHIALNQGQQKETVL